MRDSISSIQQDGYSEPLLGLVKRWRIQRLSIECMKTYKEKAFTLFNYNGLCRCHEGIATLSSSMMLEFSMNQVIEVDVQSHRLLRVNGEVANGIENNRVLDLSFMSNLRLLEVGDDCFEYVRRMRLIGLNQLERVLIGKNCFNKKDEDDRCYNPNCHFYLKNCEKLREVKISGDSFKEYSVCEIDTVPSLEVVEIGDVNNRSYNFCHASLELKSDSQRL